MAMANAELVNGAVPISTDLVNQRVCTDALTIAGLRHEAYLPFALAG